MNEKSGDNRRVGSGQPAGRVRMIGGERQRDLTLVSGRVVDRRDELDRCPGVGQCHDRLGRHVAWLALDRVGDRRELAVVTDRSGADRGERSVDVRLRDRMPSGEDPALRSRAVGARGRSRQ